MSLTLTPTSQQPQSSMMAPQPRFSAGYRSKAATLTPRPMEDLMLQDGPGRRLRKNVANVRRHIDFTSNVLNHLQTRLWQYSRRDRLVAQPDILYSNYLLPPASLPDVPVDCVMTKFVRSATNKIKCPVYALKWTPEGKRLITGASSGEFTLWNGSAFNFETILQAHDVAVRAIEWTHNDQWMLSADHDGFVKYWQPNMNNVFMFQAHKDEPIRSISFCPTDIKFVTGSDDATARIWDFARCHEERILRGHGTDVRSVDWHPIKGLVATGSRDSQQPVKLWDPKSGQCLATLYDHKNSVMAVQWNQNGNWLLTGARDHLIKLYDIRMMKEVQTFRGHKKEVTSLAWHPVHEGLFVSGGGDGSLGYWLVNTDKELALLEQAHDQAIWCVEWHPLGHILATGSNDNSTKFWARNRPGDTQEDIFGLTPFAFSQNRALTVTASTTAAERKHREEEAAVASKAAAAVAATAAADGEKTSTHIAIPGMGLDEEIYQEMNRDVPTILPSLPDSSPFGGIAGGGGVPGMAGAASVVPTTIITASGMPIQLGGPAGGGGVGSNMSTRATRQPLIKQPPPKKAQRQFERTWMVSKPTAGGGGSMDDYDFGGSHLPGGDRISSASAHESMESVRGVGGFAGAGSTILHGRLPPPLPAKSSLLGAPPAPSISLAGPPRGRPYPSPTSSLLGAGNIRHPSPSSSQSGSLVDTWRTASTSTTNSGGPQQPGGPPLLPGAQSQSQGFFLPPPPNSSLQVAPGGFRGGRGRGMRSHGNAGFGGGNNSRGGINMGRAGYSNRGGAQW